MEDNSKPMSFPQLLKLNPCKPTVVSPTDPFISNIILKKCCGINSTEEDGTPEYMVKDKEFIEQLTSFSDVFWESVRKVQGNREDKDMEKEAEEIQIKAQKEAEELKVNKVLNNEVDSFFKRRRAFVKRPCPVKIKYKSTLTHDEHAAYLKAFVKFRLRPPKTSQEQVQHAQYMALQNRVFEEQSCLMNYSFQVARLQLNEYNKIPQSIHDYMYDFVAHRCLRAQNYPELYVNEYEIPLIPVISDTHSSTIKLDHIGHLMSLGKVPFVCIPDPAVATVLPINESLRDKKTPFTDGLYNRKEYLHKTPVSEDPNAEYLALKHNVHVVMSASTFKVLANNLDSSYDKEWDIPVRIKSYNVNGPDGSNETKRIVYLDKALPKKVFFPLQKKFTYFKKVAQGTLTSVKNHPFYRMKTPYITKKTIHEDLPTHDDIFGEISDSDIESFGTELVKTPNKRNECHESAEEKFSSPQHKKRKIVRATVNNEVNKENSANDSTPSGGLLDNLLNEQNYLLNEPLTSPKRKSNCKDKKDVNMKHTNDKSKSAYPWSDTLYTDWSDYDSIRPCPETIGANHHYQLFSFGKDTSETSRYTTHEEIRLLVRHNVHGLSFSHKKNYPSKAYVITPKIENQTFFGCEVNSLSEIIEQWATLVVRPNTNLLLLRVCVESGSLIMSEQRDLQTILKEGKQPHINFQHQNALASIHSVLTTLTKMSTGNYLLHHDSKTQAFVRLLKATDRTNLSSCSFFNIHERYKDCQMKNAVYSSPPWLAIDTHVLTPFHIRHLKIPGTFPMENARRLTKNERRQKRKASDKKKCLEDLKGEVSS